ncbi:hypothetical protein KJ854_05225, partial [Patescibacteria group bacterium]|nr:hypothetical protein [Patescibacteria group bacterium]
MFFPPRKIYLPTPSVDTDTPPNPPRPLRVHPSKEGITNKFPSMRGVGVCEDEGGLAGKTNSQKTASCETASGSLTDLFSGPDKSNSSIADEKSLSKNNNQKTAKMAASGLLADLPIGKPDKLNFSIA